MKKLSLKQLNRLSPEAFHRAEKTPVVLVLDNVRSAHNVGSAFRTADAFALEEICLCGITAQPPHREILKTAIGASETMKWSYHQETPQAVRQWRDRGYRIIGVEQAEGSTALQDCQLPPSGKIALIFGNEVNGVGEEVMELLDECVEVPQFGTKHSLNISVCIGLVVWEYVKKLRWNR